MWRNYAVRTLWQQLRPLGRSDVLTWAGVLIAPGAGSGRKIPLCLTKLFETVVRKSIRGRVSGLVSMAPYSGEIMIGLRLASLTS